MDRGESAYKTKNTLKEIEEGEADSVLGGFDPGLEQPRAVTKSDPTEPCASSSESESRTSASDVI